MSPQLIEVSVNALVGGELRLITFTLESASETGAAVTDAAYADPTVLQHGVIRFSPPFQDLVIRNGETLDARRAARLLAAIEAMAVPVTTILRRAAGYSQQGES